MLDDRQRRYTLFLCHWLLSIQRHMSSTLGKLWTVASEQDHSFGTSGTATGVLCNRPKMVYHLHLAEAKVFRTSSWNYNLLRIVVEWVRKFAP